jgi:light-regulated signal transduction histidine kinase (bacteriophytochrome)
MGAVDYLSKPFAPSFLKAKVSVFVELYRKTALERKAKERMAMMAEELAKSNDELEQSAYTISLERKAKERMAMMAEELTKSNAELEQFAYIASHDLQEPLRKIKSFTELLAQRYQGKLDEKADEFMHYITDGAERMQRLINGLLSYSRITTQGQPLKSVDFNRLLDQTLSLIQMKINETRTVLTVDPLPTLKVDEIQIGQLFQNLILNAIKFKGEKPPRIHISAQPVSEDTPNVQRPNFGMWQFSVSDNGIGIPPEQSERVFRIFQRLHLRGQYPGEGMGLAICKKIVERHGGKIWIENKGPDKGSIFYFTLS